MMTIGTFLTDTFRTPTLPISSNPCLSPFCGGTNKSMGELLGTPLVPWEYSWGNPTMNDWSKKERRRRWVCGVGGGRRYA